MELSSLLTLTTVNFPCNGFQVCGKQVSKRETEHEGDTDLVFGNRPYKNTCQRNALGFFFLLIVREEIESELFNWLFAVRIEWSPLS